MRLLAFSAFPAVIIVSNALTARAERAEAEVERLRAAVERVLELHCRDDCGDTTCEHCPCNCGRPWPCDTLRALDGVE